MFDAYIDIPSFISDSMSYPLEVWTTRRGFVAIVTDVPDNTSLMNANEKIAAAVWDRWPGARIIENWPGKTADGLQFFDTSGTGGHARVDTDSLSEAGLKLPV
ncbi:hypothetical protein GS896_25515 [Rhodococcus hoagii]|nr:hypothetical protein [Prescottella equi]NKT55981.1 hypothetical protein [Prescottella equi]NKU37394.1 hypothetical protein [Prescottella equi]NKZ79733.1 hypothetical protein [Prescottella equi]